MSSPQNKRQQPRRTRGRVLAIDYGRKRMGLALSDELGLTSQPLATLERSDRRSDLRRLREVVRAQDVQRVIVGHPVHLNGSSGEMADKAARFAARIRKELGLPVELVDERLSSWEAAHTAIEGGKRGGKTRHQVDAVAAAVILRDYLDREQTRKQSKG